MRNTDGAKWNLSCYLREQLISYLGKTGRSRIPADMISRRSALTFQKAYSGTVTAMQPLRWHNLIRYSAPCYTRGTNRDKDASS